MSRQTKYERDGWNEKLGVIEGWARDGLTDKQIAGKMGISEVTLNSYKKKYPKFFKSLKKGKEVVDYQVEKALLNKALGGDTTAQIFWLKNRRPDKWRDKQEHKVEQDGNITINIEGV